MVLYWFRLRDSLQAATVKCSKNDFIQNEIASYFLISYSNEIIPTTLCLFMFPVLFYLNYNFSFPLIKVAISETAISVSVKKMSFITCV